MTGFGRADGVAGALVWRWEVRSVNGKGLDARLRLPGGHERLEPAARELIEKGSPCGRKLDFQIQELMREANTLCSKSADMELTRIGLDLKAVVDQMKEQTANVE